MSYNSTPPPPPPPPGQYGGQPVGMPKPDSNLVWAILTTLFCCLPFGIVAIVQASKVDSLWATGQYEMAQAASASAKKWSLVAAAVGLAGGLIYAVIVVLGIAAGSTGA